MGLDMYLEGRKSFLNMGLEPDIRMEDDLNIKAVVVELGYWRKHPDLHGFIVQAFADGDDDCRPISLDEEKILTIMEAIEDKALPSTSGFFFGSSEGSQEEREADLATFRHALKWLKDGEGKQGEWRSVYYEASW